MSLVILTELLMTFEIAPLYGVLRISFVFAEPCPCAFALTPVASLSNRPHIRPHLDSASAAAKMGSRQMLDKA